jgi:type III pantothenate kinase
MRSEAWLTHDVVRIFASDVPDRVIASNVAGPHVAQQLREQCGLSGVPLTLIQSRAEQCGVTSRYRDPAQLGTDRWAALIGARAARQGATLVIVAGTATTVDMLDAKGVFQGGIIIPGIALMRESLSRGTAQLPDVAGEYSRFPASTEEAIASGTLLATLGAIERMGATLRDQVGSEVALVLSGGAAPALLPHLPAAEVREHLVLEGLAAIAGDTFR